jgi:hypothetical protein
MGIESFIKPRKKIPIIIQLIQLLIANQNGMEVKGRATIDLFQDIGDRPRLAEGTNGGQTIGAHGEEGTIFVIHGGSIGQFSKRTGDIGSRLMGTCDSRRFAARGVQRLHIDAFPDGFFDGCAIDDMVSRHTFDKVTIAFKQHTRRGIKGLGNAKEMRHDVTVTPYSISVLGIKFCKNIKFCKKIQ